MLERFEDKDGFVGYRSPLLAALGIPHLFTTRIGTARRELDLGKLDARTRQRLRRAAGAREARFVRVHQIHGAQVLLVDSGELPAESAQADALVSERPDVLIGVHVADCVPVLLARGDGKRVAAVHAGWRGLVAGVLPRALDVLRGGDVLREDVVLGPDAVAALGPCIDEESFEVGPEVADAFARAGMEHAIRERFGSRAHIDLRAAAEEQLRSGGVRLVDSTDRCTYRDEGEFFSYRRDVTHGGRERTGRLGAWVGVARRSREDTPPPIQRPSRPSRY